MLWIIYYQTNHCCIFITSYVVESSNHDFISTFRLTIDLSLIPMTDITEEKIMKCLYSKYDIAQLAINDALSFLLQSLLCWDCAMK